MEPVQLGVGMGKHIAEVLKGLAEFSGVTLGEIIEKVVLHSVEPAETQEAEACRSSWQGGPNREHRSRADPWNGLRGPCHPPS